jgi:hypothetical protein
MSEDGTLHGQPYVPPAEQTSWAAAPTEVNIADLARQAEGDWYTEKVATWCAALIVTAVAIGAVVVVVALVLRAIG